MTAKRYSSGAISRSLETDAKAPKSFVETLNRKRRSRGHRRPAASSPSPSISRRAAPGLSYEAAARLRPKLWTGSRTDLPTPKPPSRLEIVRKRSYGIISEPSVGNGSDQEGQTSTPRRKKARRVSPPPPSREGGSSGSPSFLCSDILRRRYGGGCIVQRRHVAFADPIVSEVRTRPRTPRGRIADLFYCKADEARFRREERLRRRLQENCKSRSSGDEEEEVAMNAGESQDDPSSGQEHDDDPNEVTESDDSSSSDEDMDDRDVANDELFHA